MKALQDSTASDLRAIRDGQAAMAEMFGGWTKRREAVTAQALLDIGTALDSIMERHDALEDQIGVASEEESAA
jgi:hypothetical protein